MKRIIALFLCVLMLFAVGCSSAPAKDNSLDEVKSPDANTVAKEMGLGISLGNTFEAYNATDCDKTHYEWMPVVGNNTPEDYETNWGAVPTTQKVIDGMRDCGFNTVRIPVYWGNMMENDGTWTINADYIARIKEIVDYCENAGVYSVINIHHFDEFIIRRNDLQNCKEIFTTLWTQIADYFKDYPYTVVFEGFNEYLGGNQFNENGDLVEQGDPKAYLMTNVLNQAFVDAVRATGGNNAERVLVVSGYWTNIDKTSSPQFAMPTDTIADRLMVSVHYVDNAMYWARRIGTQDWLNYIEDQCQKLKKAFSDKNIPVFMGETSAGYPAENFGHDAIHTESSECLEIVLTELVEYGFVPVIWDVNDNFYSRTEYKIKLESNEKVVEKIVKKLK
ncbi:MAG: glycoside hydrolase family 5 protein [Oscillospiraceae bacterium]|nr:glycoside hydrolase family 5 protein [Oscillospiraceae bacterium]